MEISGDVLSKTVFYAAGRAFGLDNKNGGVSRRVTQGIPAQYLAIMHCDLARKGQNDYTTTQHRHITERSGTMSMKPLFSSVIVFGLAAFATSVRAEDFDCFPLCDAQVKLPVSILCGQEKTVVSSPVEGAIENAEALNQQLKPVKEIIGYIHSPQSLAMKLVNDYIVKIPAWVGYVMDPVGSLKNKAMGEVRTRAVTALKDSVTRTDSCLAAEGISFEETSLPTPVTIPLVSEANAI